MLSRMAPSSPPDMRTLHLLRTPDILCANDNRPPGSYHSVTAEQGTKLGLRSATIPAWARVTKLPQGGEANGLECIKIHRVRSNAVCCCALPPSTRAPAETRGARHSVC